MWRDQIFFDPELRHAAFRVGYALAGYITMARTTQIFCDTGRINVYPSYQSLIRDAHVSEDTVRTALRQLIQLNHLAKVRRGNQYTGSNVYRIRIAARNPDKEPSKLPR